MRFLLELFFFFMVPLPAQIGPEPPASQAVRFPALLPCIRVRFRVRGAASAALLWRRQRKFHLLGFRDSTSVSGSRGAPCARARYSDRRQEMLSGRFESGLPWIGTWCAPRRRSETPAAP